MIVVLSPHYDLTQKYPQTSDISEQLRTMDQHATGSSTKSGPSAEAWAYHKAMIIDLYKHNPLKRVQSVMEEDHGFFAR